MYEYRNYDELLKDLTQKELEVKEGSWLNVLLAGLFGKRYKSPNGKTLFSVYRNELYLLKMDFSYLTK
jgi:hypothetical protein